MAHLEIVGAIVTQLAKTATTSEIENSPMGAYFIDHGRGVYPTAASGFPFSAASIAVKGDPIADLTEDLAAEATTLQEQQNNKMIGQAVFKCCIFGK